MSQRISVRSRRLSRPIISPRAGDIGEERKHIELEPVEEPVTVPVTVPEQEPVPA